MVKKTEARKIVRERYGEIARQAPVKASPSSC